MRRLLNRKTYWQESASTILGDQMLAIFLQKSTSKGARVRSPVDVSNVIDKRRGSAESINPDSHQSDKKR
jgi:hypothetical protein